MRLRPQTNVLHLVLGGVLLFPLRAADPEDELKAATVLAFLQHAQWQDTASTGKPLVIGVVGRPDFANLLQRALDGKAVNGRGVKVMDPGSPPDPRCCQVLYVGGSKKTDIQQALAGTVSAHVLTIGETDRFLEYGGAVELFLNEGHMAFEVSLDALNRAGISISSKLLRFGRIRELAGGKTTP